MFLPIVNVTINNACSHIDATLSINLPGAGEFEVFIDNDDSILAHTSLDTCLSGMGFQDISGQGHKVRWNSLKGLSYEKALEAARSSRYRKA